MSIGHPPARPFTVGDLEEMPDDGRRYELIDGTLVVTPVPYGRAGLDHYWVVDPLSPSLAVYGRDASALVLTASVSGDQPHEATVPAALRVVPADLVR